MQFFNLEIFYENCVYNEGGGKINIEILNVNQAITKKKNEKHRLQKRNNECVLDNKHLSIIYRIKLNIWL